MTEQRQDRRSLRTQHALLDALIALLAAKSYNEISINDIIDRANVGRSTFYAHYQAKDDLLKSGFERVLDMLIHQIRFGEADQCFDWIPRRFSAMPKDIMKFTGRWSGGPGFDVLTKDGHAALSAKFQERFTLLLSGRPEPSIPLVVLSYSMAGTLLILLKWWLDHKIPYSPEHMDEIFQQLVMPGARNILGITETKDN